MKKIHAMHELSLMFYVATSNQQFLTVIPGASLDHIGRLECLAQI